MRYTVNEFGCWIHNNKPNNRGYPQLHIGGRWIPAHRASYILHNGTIPNGLWVCHKCDVRNCINPDHLFLGTVSDNNADMRAKGRGTKGETHPNTKLTDESIEDIRGFLKIGITHARIAHMYNVSRPLITLIANDYRKVRQ